jgi:hypothetical protein
MTQAKTTVAEKKETAVATNDLASMFVADASGGLQNVETEDLALPFLKIISKLDPILDERDDVKAGDIINTVTNDIVKGKTGIKVVPCFFQVKYIRWSPRGSGTGAPVAIYDRNDPAMPEVKRDPNDNREYVQDGSGDYIEQTAQWYVKYIPVKGGATNALIALKMSQLKKSKKWLSIIMSQEMDTPTGKVQKPMFSQIYSLKTVSEENSKGSWHGWEMSLDKEIDDINLYKSCKSFSESIEKGEVKVKHTQDGQETSESEDVPF